jgi:hypothetical protein
MQVEKKRDDSQDYFKGLLVIGMITAHVILLNGLENRPPMLSWFCVFINLITFSGFLFSFGFIYQKVYSNKKKTVKEIISISSKTLLAFYFSGLAYHFFFRETISSHFLLKVFLFYNIASYSEFLLSFFLITLLFFIFKKFFNKIVESTLHTVIVVAVCIAFTLLPLNYRLFIPFTTIEIEQLGLIIGKSKYFSFPVAQYLMFFVIGMYFAKHNIVYNHKAMALATVFTLSFCVYYYLYRTTPSRFPPGTAWVLGSAFFIYAYYLLAKKVLAKYNIPFLRNIGKNTLIYLVLSNVLMFAIRSIKLFEFQYIPLLTFLIIAFIYWVLDVAKK